MHYYEILKPTECYGEAFDILLSLGWYPIGQAIFTTSHLFEDDETIPLKVHWLRFPVDSIRKKTSHKRIYKRNSQLEIELVEPFVYTETLNNLYKKYLSSVDFDGYATIEEATYGEDNPNIFDTKAIIVREGEKIVSCGIFHVGVSSIASILHFYDPQYKKFSPGKYLILKTLDYCRANDIEFYYPGYVVQGNPKMDYKLFLGKDVAQYYHPEPTPLSGSWKTFQSDLLSYADNKIPQL